MESILYRNVKRLCDKYGTSTFTIEKKLGFGNATIDRWKSADPSISNVKKVADFFGCTIDELMKDPKEDSK